MAEVTFITGNQDKADFMAKYLGFPLRHQKLDLDELQSLDIKYIAEHKVREAYKIINSPVLIEDMGLSFSVLGKLPGTLTKWFVEELGLEGMCRMLDSFNDRTAVAEICFAYYDGRRIKFFEGKMKGSIATHPRGDGGFGWNPIFIPAGSHKTYAEMDDEETREYSLRTATVYPNIKKFLEELDKK